MEAQHKNTPPGEAGSKLLSGITSLKNQSYPKWIRIVAGILIVLFVIVVIERILARHEVNRVTRDLAVPSVIVTHPTAGSPDINLVLPGNVQPYASTPIFARTDGYVKRWLVDIGAPVKEGQMLAEIDSPEVDRQYDQAQAAVNQAAANLKLAQDTAQRWKYLLQKNTVSQQDSEQKQKEMEASQANLDQMQANLERLAKLKSFEQITAPFDGTVTMRNINVGDLINAGSSSAREMFRIDQDNILRVYVSVPEAYASQVKVGQTAKIKLASLPDQEVPGRVTNTAAAIDPQSRTMLTQVQVDNAQGQYLAGGYATVDFPLHLSKPVLTVPANTLLFRPDGTMIGLVDKDGIVALKKVEIGKDFGNAVEIIQGVEAGDRVIVNPSDSLQSGNKVKAEFSKSAKHS